MIALRPALGLPRLLGFAWYGFLALAGAAHAASTAWPLAYFFTPGQTLWFLQIAAMTVLAQAMRRTRSAREAFFVGLVFGATALGATFWWLFVAMHTYGGLDPGLAAAAVLALALFLALYLALACAAWRAWFGSAGAAGAAAFGALWMASEMARGTWLTGFAWGAGGYSHLSGPLSVYAPWMGVYGLGGLSAGLAMAVMVWTSPSAPPRAGRHPTVWAMVLVAVLWIPYAAQDAWNGWSRSNGALSVTLLQGNIAQSEKFEPDTGVARALHWYREQLLLATSSLVVAPETALPVLPQDLPEGYLADLKAGLAASGRSAIVGLPLGDATQGYSNSVLALVPGAMQDLRYDKHHLVPFGEFIPPAFRWFTDLMHIPLGDFQRGALGQPSFVLQGQRLAANICYEDLFGEELATRFGDAALAPTVFVNVSNLGWFGNTIAIDQHLNIARMRALEFQRPFVRATNTGATVILNHQGQIQASMPRFTAGALVGQVQGREGLTPFAWWASRWGLWPLWWIAFGLLAWGAWAQRRGFAP
ncbi:MAG: apolipoprotein N-acyltransferase [Betaproteobacteria bacterium]